MEHEVFVPVPAETLRQALRNPAGVARSIPGLQRDASGPDATAADVSADASVDVSGQPDAEGAQGGHEPAGTPLTGRLKLRLGGRTITYRGELTFTEQPDGVFAVSANGVEARGTGSGQAELTVRLVTTDDGTTLVLSATAAADGRATEIEQDTAEAGARSLFNHFAQKLAVEAVRQPAAADDAAGPVTPPEAAAPPVLSESLDAEDHGSTSVFDTAVPAPSLDPLADDDTEPVAGADAQDADGGDGTDGLDDAELIEVADSEPVGNTDDVDLDAEVDEEIVVPDVPPAEAAHARRTMIGRSAEEVDHAPPRGRYAPVPAPEPTSASDTLRWAAPAAAVVLASAVVVGRALRRRR